MNQLTHWRLFVDESGSFSAPRDPREHLVLAGVLMRERDGHGLATELLALTRRFFPGLPTPLHAAHLFSPAFHLLHRHAGPTVGPLREPLEALAAGVGVKGLARLDEAAGGHDVPPFAVLEAWTRLWLPSGGALAASVKALREQVQLRVHRILSAIAAAYGPDGCALVGVVHAEGEDARDTATLYPQMFTTMAERVLSLRRQRPQAHEEVFVLAEERGGVTRDLLAASLLAAEGFPLLLPERLPDPQLRLHALEPQGKDGQDPGIVLADLAAALLRRHAPGFRSWSELLSWAPHGLGLPVQLCAPGLGEGALPTLTTLRSSDWLREGLWSTAPGPSDPPRGWGGDQARRWLAAARTRTLEVAA